MSTPLEPEASPAPAPSPTPGPGAAGAPLPAQPRNPLHGLRLEDVVGALAAHFGWAGLGERIPLRCFTSDPSIGSSLKFLRKTPWAREKVESLYLFMLREQRRTRPAAVFSNPVSNPTDKPAGSDQT